MILLAADKRTKKGRGHLRLRFNQTGNNATFTRSDIGNISNVNLNGTGAARSYSDVHELTSLGGQTQIFDADGNLVTHSSSMALGWDDAGRLETASPDSNDYDGTVAFGYDASGKRSFVTKTPNGGSAATTVYIYAGPNCIAEYNSGTAAASPDVEFVYAAGGAGLGIDSLVLVDDGSSELAVLRNQQWSITALVNNSTGSVAERYAYDHFGKRTIYAANGTTVKTASSHKNPYGYTSRRHDVETGLMYYRARYYDTDTGEFVSQDSMEYVDGMSQYRGYFVPGSVDPNGFSRGVIEKFDVELKSKGRGPIQNAGANWGDVTANQRFTLSTPKNVDDVKKITGFIVQVIYGNIRKKGQKTRTWFYVERWRVIRGKVISIHGDTFSFSGTNDGSTGSYQQVGLAFFTSSQPFEGKPHPQSGPINSVDLGPEPWRVLEFLATAESPVIERETSSTWACTEGESTENYAPKQWGDKAVKFEYEEKFGKEIDNPFFPK